MNHNNWIDLFPKEPGSFHNKIVQTLEALPKEEEKYQMNKKIPWKKIAVMTAAAVLVLGTTAFALGKITGVTTHSSSKASYKEMPDADEIEKLMGVSAKITETFSNGYRFTEGRVGDSQATDANGQVIKEYKTLSITYKKDEDTVSCYMNPYLNEENSDGAVLAETVNGIDLYYVTFMNKFVGGDYIMTDQDKADEESGKYIFSFGVEIEDPVHVQTLYWSDGGIDYTLLLNDSVLTKDDLLTMAKEIIEK